MLKNVLGLYPEELVEHLIQIGEQKYRVNQILNWLYNLHETDIRAMTTLSEKLRTKLLSTLQIDLPKN